MRCCRIAFAGRNTPQKRWKTRAAQLPAPSSNHTEDLHPPQDPEAAVMALNSDVLQLIFMQLKKVMEKPKYDTAREHGDCADTAAS